MIEDEERPVAATVAPGILAQDIGGRSSTSGAEQAQAPKPGAMNGADFQTYIGRGLRAVFDDVAQQPIPDRFIELMRKLG